MNLEEFREYARSYNVIPVTRKLLADGETPLGIYRKLAKSAPNTFLLESAEHGGAWSRYSFIGVRTESTLSEKDGAAIWIGTYPAGAPQGIDPLQALRISATHLKSPVIDGLPPLTGGLVGYMGYDTVRRLEKIGSTSTKDLPLPELAFMLTSDLAVMDHSDGTVTLIANAINWDGSDNRVDEAYAECVARLDRMQKELNSPLDGFVSELEVRTLPDFDSNTTEEKYRQSVKEIKEEILAGEAFQVVLSQYLAASEQVAWPAPFSFACSIRQAPDKAEPRGSYHWHTS